MMCDIFNRIKRKWIKLRLQPIRVLCFHQTSEQYDANIYCKPDWIPLDFLKGYVAKLQLEGYEFISLQDAYRHIHNDIVRRKKYAVLTADDGLKCQLDLVPWLAQQNIPITLFVNIETLDGETCGVAVRKYFKIKDKQTEMAHARELYLTEGDLNSLSSLVTIGMHGVTHESIDRYTDTEFEDNVETCINALKAHPNYKPFYAYTYGKCTSKSDYILRSMNLLPVYTDGKGNYNDSSIIHREVFEYIYNRPKSDKQ